VSNLIKKLAELKELVEGAETRIIAVAAAEDQDIMDVVKAAGRSGMAQFILVGDGEKIKSLMNQNGIQEDLAKVIHVPGHKAAAEKVVELAKSGDCHAIMKGNLHTSIFLKAMLDKEKGVTKGGLLSQVSVYDKVYGEGLQLLTDCVMSITPTLEEKSDIIRNAVELAHKLGYEKPNVALLSAVEVINPKIPDTLDAAILSKMCDRGQIKGCVVDGPFALDNALSGEAAKHKGIQSPVAGNADIIVAPNLQVGNVLHKAIVYMAKKDVAAAIMGADVPVIATSRTDTVASKLLTMRLALYLART